MSEWQPIETAPKDGRRIVGLNAAHGHLAVVAFSKPEWECYSFNGTPMGLGFYPTHWMPLPEPPSD